MPVEVQSVSPMLRTWDLAGSVEFYTKILGFKCRGFEPESEWGWASVECGPTSIMLSAPNEHEGDASPKFTRSIYFRVLNVDALWSELQGKAKVSYPVETFDYGMREFAIYDNNGYLLQFGESVE
jgi:uncharacterized glyoxalase superfamily protein PhnB